MAQETLSISAIVAGTDVTTIEKMEADLNSLTSTTQRTSTAAREQTGAMRQADQGMSALDRTASRVTDTMKGVLAAFGVTAGIAGMVSFLKSSAVAFSEQEQAMRGVGVAAQLVGESYDIATARAASLTAVLQRKTGIEDQEQMKSLAKMTNITQDYELSLKALPIAMDLAAAGGVDLQTAVQALALTMQGLPARMPLLRAIMKDYKDQALSAAEVLEIVSGRIGGSAEKMAQTTTGQINIAKAQWKDLKERIGEFALFFAGSFAQSVLPILERLSSGTGLKIKAGSETTGLDALVRFQKGIKEEHLQIPFIFTRTGADVMHQLDLMRQMTPLAFERFQIEKEIAAELEKGGATYDSILQKSLKILDIQKKEKNIRKDIAGLITRRGTESIGELGDFLSAFGEKKKKFPDLPGVDVRVGNRFISGSELTGEEQGVSRFSMFQEELLKEQLSRRGLPSALRADLAGQIFQTNLAQLKQATTPEMAGRQLEESVQAFNDLQTEKAAQLGEQAAEKLALINNTALTVSELQQIRGVLERIAASATINPKGFEAMKRDELE